MTVHPAAAVDDPMQPTTSRQADATPASWYGLAVLVVVSLYGFVDRQVFVLLAEPIKLSMNLTDLQLGLLQGLGVAVFAAVVSYPIAWLADRHDRRVVLSACIVVWSLAVLACGMARDFNELFAASAIVGAGEAGLVPIVFALIPELFRNDKRQLANSINTVAGRLGVGLAVALCGYLIAGAEWARPLLPASLKELEGWRLSFFAAALPAPLFVLLMLTLPLHRSVDAAVTGTDTTRPSRAAVMPKLLPYLRAHRATMVSFNLGLGGTVFGIAAVAAWLPIVAMRQFGATPVQVGNALGAALFVSGAIGLLTTYYGMRWLRPRFGPALPVIGLAISVLLGASSFGLLLLATSATTLFAIYGIQLSCLMAGYMLYPTALQNMAPARLRGRLTSFNAIILLGFGAGAPPLVGLLSDQWQQRSNGLLLAVTLLGAFGMLFGSVAMLWCSRHFAATVRAAERADAADTATAT